MTQVDHRGFVAAGDVFVVVKEYVDGVYFKIGDIVELYRDDGSNCPGYQNVLTGAKHYYYTDGLQKLEQIEVNSAVELPEGTEVIFLGYIPGNNGSYHGHWDFVIGEKFTAGIFGHLVSGRDGRELTWNWGFKLAILPTDADQQEAENVEELSYCEENGYKVGDKFLVTHGALFDNGSVVELIEDDGTTCPRFRLISGHCRYSDGKAYATIADCMTKIEEVENIQVEAPATVEQKRDRIIVISGLIANLQAEEAELRAQLRAAGFQLIEPEAASAIPDGVSVTDSRTWQKGDIVRCTTKQGKGTATLTVGGEYTIVCIDSDGDRYITDDDGDDVYYCVKSCFEFVRRP